jgi:hypothetical protein
MDHKHIYQNLSTFCLILLISLFVNKSVTRIDDLLVVWNDIPDDGRKMYNTHIYDS